MPNKCAARLSIFVKKSLSIFGLGNDPSKILIKLNSGYGYEVVLTKGYGYFEAVTVTSKFGQGGFWIKDGASLEVKDCRMVSRAESIVQFPENYLT